MIKFLICMSDGHVSPNKLNKMMFYADFLHYKLYGVSISGLEYQALRYGPVPLHSETIYDNISEVKRETFFLNHIESPLLVCTHYNVGIFTEDELQTLKTICEQFKAVSAEEITQMSLEEEALLEYKNKLIPYYIAFDLKQL